MIKVDGRAIAQKIFEDLKKRPTSQKILAAVFVGMNPASESFLRIKRKMAQDLGVNFQLFQLAEAVGQDDVESKVRELSNDPQVGGIIVQLPLPKNFDRERILALIDSKKDVDALSPSSSVESPVVGVVKDILKNVGWELVGKKIAVIGKGRLVGGPIIKWLEGESLKISDLKFKAADINTGDLKSFVADADLVISGVGKEGLIKGEWLKAGAGVIDFGSPSDFDMTKTDHLSFYTPTPGGTGPILVAKLFQNFYKLNS